MASARSWDQQPAKHAIHRDRGRPWHGLHLGHAQPAIASGSQLGWHVLQRGGPALVYQPGYDWFVTPVYPSSERQRGAHLRTEPLS